MSDMNREFLLNARPVGDIKDTDFKLVETDIPQPGPDEVLVQVQFLAVEPAMRGWMENRADYVAPLEIGDRMRGWGAGKVIESNNSEFPVGTIVSGSFGWQEYVVSDGKSIPPAGDPGRGGYTRRYGRSGHHRPDRLLRYAAHR